MTCLKFPNTTFKIARKPYFMHTFQESDDDNLPLAKFELMLKTNDVYFFDSSEFEEIILHYTAIGKISLAKKALALGLKQHPQAISLKLVQIDLLIQDQKIDLAQHLLERLEMIAPSNDQVFLQKAVILSQKSKHKEAIESLKQALAITDDPNDVWSMIGMEYLFLEDYSRALNSFIKCIEVEYDDYSSLYNVVYCFDMLEQHKEAIDYLENYIEKDPYCEVAWHQLGLQYFYVKNFRKALQAFDYAILIDEYFIGAYLEKGKTLEELGEYKEAIKYYEKSISIEEGSSFAYLRIGKCYEIIGNKKQALKYYNITVKEDPLLDKAWMALTDLYINDGNYEKALYFINKALQIDSENTLYWSRLGEINLKLNFFEEAVRAFRKCIALEDYSLDVFLALTDLLQFLGEFDDAIEVLLQAQGLYTDFAEIEFRLGALYIAQHQMIQGLHFFEKGLKLNYEFHRIIKTLFPSIFNLKSVQLLVEKYKTQ